MSKSVTAVRAIPHLLGRRIDLTWQNPPASEFSGSPSLVGLVIVRRDRTFAETRETGTVIYDGAVISQFSDRDLLPLTTYYYTLFTKDSSGTLYHDSSAQVAAFSTEDFHLSDRLYQLLPSVHQRYDNPLSAADLVRFEPAIVEALNSLPTALQKRGQLWRFFYSVAAPLNTMRSFAEGLRQLYQIDQVRPEFLPLLAQWIGWNLDHTLPISAQRNEILFAPQFYRGMGTIPTLRSLVTRYTGWYTQIAEFTQNIVLSNQPAQLNLFALQSDAMGWRGIGNAAPLLGFGIGNDRATGTNPTTTTPATVATLISSRSQPFSLQRDLELTITSDDRIPITIRFQINDFVDIHQATAQEIATVLNRLLSEVTAIPRSDGRLELRSHLRGAKSSLRVEQSATSLVSLEGAPQGRLTSFRDRNQRIRLFYVTVDPLIPNVDRRQQVRYKTFREGTWGESYALLPFSQTAQTEPTAVELSDGRIWIAWLQPSQSSKQLNWMLGQSQSAQSAQLVGHRSQPFRIIPGTTLLLHQGNKQSQGIRFSEADLAGFSDRQRATAAEVATVLNARLSGIVVSAQPDNTLQFSPSMTGGDSSLEIDLVASSAAQSLGFDASNSVAHGSWGDQIIGSTPQAIALPAGDHADLQAIVDSTSGVRLFWSMHRDSRWQIVSRRWQAQTWIATAAGVSVRRSDNTWTTYTTANGLVSNNIRSIAIDAEGKAWVGTDAGISVGNSNTWSTIVAAPNALLSNNIRSITLALDRSAWIATDAGVSVRHQAGWTNFTTATPNTLLSNDTRSITIDSDGNAWIATSAGVSVYRTDHTWINYTTINGLISNDARMIAFDPHGNAWIATSAGISIYHANHTWSSYTVTDGLTSNDIRMIAFDLDGNAWIATSAGVSVYRTDHTWTTYSIVVPNTLISNDIRSVLIESDRSVWMVTANGVSIYHSDETWSSYTSAIVNTLASNDGRAIQGNWSAIDTLADGWGSNREPYAVVDNSNRIWLFWSRRQGVSTPEDIWTLRQRVWTPGSGWSAEVTVTTPPTTGRFADREPAAIRLPDNTLQVFFQSDRAGGSDLWSLIVTPAANPETSPVSTPVTITNSAPNDRSPAPVLLSDGTLWLLYRSDRSIPLSRLSTRSLPVINNRVTSPQLNSSSPNALQSFRLPDTGTLRRFAGSTTIVPADLTRNALHQRWDDLLCYTPQNTLGITQGETPTEKDLYTRGTIGIYVSPLIADSPLSRQRVDRLKPLLQEFLPIQVRAVVILAPRIDLELVYQPGADILETFWDKYPIVESYTGLSDTSTDILPDWILLLSNTLSHVSVNPTDLTTLRRRTYSPLFVPPPA